MLNRVVLVGRLVADPELRYTPSGLPVSSMRIAVDRPRARDATERQTDFINLVAWRQRAEFAANYLTKGRLVAVEGRLQIREWTTQDGQRRRTAEVVCDNLQGLDRPREPGAPSREEEPESAEKEAPSQESETPDPWEDQ